MDNGIARPVPLSDLGQAGRAPKGARSLGVVVSAALHVAALLAFAWVQTPPPPEPDAVAMSASLVRLPKPDPDKPPEPVKPSPAKAGGRQSAVRPARLEAPTVIVPAKIPKPDTSDLLSEAQIAGASSVGEGGGGGGGGVCDMAKLVQRALRKDPLVQAAVSGAQRTGKAMMVWNGDWVKSGDQDGKGLAAVRESIMWEVAFAPEACRRQQMHGLVLLSLSDGYTRLALGSGVWRWSDLLTPSAMARER
ncbi:MAG TPA: hypothetical protein VG960_13175 [Caulobacteraceae bacterium]|nr:hypothetical protein [Caulobacteraceae bacterium]